MKKGCCLGMLPGDLEIEERLALAKRLGFDAVEPNTLTRKTDVRKLKTAAENTGVEIASIMNSDHWKYPLSSPRKREVERSIKGMKTSLENAAALGTDCVLLVPAVVNEQVTYEEAWTRSRAAIRRLLPTAERLGVRIAVENVWNKFLLSPIEFKDYVESFKNKWLKAYFDVGNILLYGYPQHWIRTLARRRLARVHIKDFDLATKQFVPLREGDVDWPAVRQALEDIRYNGTITAEVQGGDEKTLRSVSTAMDKIIAGE